MNIHTFIANYQEAFDQHAELPIAFWYSDRMEASTEKVTGCLFKCMKQVRDGKTVSLSNETITCGGGKFYTGFTEMPERVPGFVSLKEKYKKTPEMVVDFVNELQIPKADKAYLHFARIDKIPSFDEVEGVLFLPTPDILSGLVHGPSSTTMHWMPWQPHSVPAVAPSLPKPSLKTGNKGNALSWDSSTPPSAHTSKRTY